MHGEFPSLEYSVRFCLFRLKVVHEKKYGSPAAIILAAPIPQIPDWMVGASLPLHVWFPLREVHEGIYNQWQKYQHSVLSVDRTQNQCLNDTGYWCPCRRPSKLLTLPISPTRGATVGYPTAVCGSRWCKCVNYIGNSTGNRV
jgi:hypothetical protein